MVGMLGMLIGPVASGFSAVSSKESMKQQAKDAKSQTEDLVKRLEDVRQKQVALTNELKAEFTEYWDNLEKINAKIRIAKRQHSEAYRKIQMWGLIMVGWMGFLLIMKKFIQLWQEWK